MKALEESGVKDLTVIRVDAFASLADTDTDRHYWVRKYAEKYSAIVKLELVCRNEDANRFAKVIRERARTGQHEDGRVFIATVDEAVNIRTGISGIETL